MKPLTMAAACATALALLTALACRATIEVEPAPGTPFLGGSKIKMEIDGRNVSPKPDENGGFPQPGDCVKLTFHGPNGEVLGSEEVPAGGSAEAPPGTDSVTWSPCDPKDDDPKKKARPSSPPQSFVADPLGRHLFRSIPVDLGDGHGRYLDYSVVAPTFSRAEAIAADFELDLLADPRPTGVRTYGFADVELLQGASVRVSIVTWKAPTSFELSWNGQQVADDLQDAALVQTPGGWWTTTVVVPSSLVEQGPSSSNEVSYAVATSEGELTYRLELSVQP
jgi:hypothetical protein